MNCTQNRCEDEENAESELVRARLRTLVEMESPSGHREGIAECLSLIRHWAGEALGRHGEIREIDGVDHLYFEAADPGGILLLGHADTVWPVGTLGRLPFAVDDGRARGPGVFDMKSGLVATIGALERLVAQGRRGCDDISLLITGDEETGSITSRRLIEEAAAHSSAVLILEPSLDGAVKIARRGAGIYRIGLKGRAAHAGLEPEKGANALAEMASVLQRLALHSDESLGTTVSPTFATAGTAVNTIPELAEVAFDVRAWSLDELERVDAAFRSTLPRNPEIALTLGGGINRPPLEREHAEALHLLARQVAEDLGQTPLDGVEVGGASDGNFTASLGTPTLDGLGPLGDGAHAEHEWADLESIIERADLVAELIRRIRRHDSDHTMKAEGEKQ
ncbi:M20 family metallopeptidase [Brevibacterium marinum]|uniref:Glutamate carboxypeptidase n=1 Tax=Brevibacterium marinum TaxID=418643 RepID=A0A846RUW3_9MICO|nr:M20 family metallopeptidase [Brevibacterium marinum]NJC55766.1 glutamate carboxypeptidase [Brevibacterium marinum]